ncbi:MAG: hypothetical protein LBF05_05610 [Tannerella sp.]|jgi:hypothetical protein|nr:hypothetical protein [Tannerella sp.]
MRSVFLTYESEIPLLGRLFVARKRLQAIDNRREYVPDLFSGNSGGRENGSYSLRIFRTWRRAALRNVRCCPAGTSGSFRKAVTVYGHMDNVPSQLSVIGETVN